MNRPVVLSLGILAFAALASVTVLTRAGAIEEDVALRSAAALRAGGAGWAEVRTRGRDVVLSGLAPDGRSREDALRLARSVRGAGDVLDETRTAPSAARPAPVGPGGPGPKRPDPPPVAPTPAEPRAPAPTADPPDGGGTLTAAACQARVDEILKATRIFSDFAMGSIGEDGDAALEKLARLLQRCPGARIEVGAHTQPSRNEEFDLEWTGARARAVAKKLVEHGVPEGRIRARGYGGREPVTRGGSPLDLAKNNRVEIQLVEAR